MGFVTLIDGINDPGASQLSRVALSGLSCRQVSIHRELGSVTGATDPPHQGDSPCCMLSTTGILARVLSVLGRAVILGWVSKYDTYPREEERERDGGGGGVITDTDTEKVHQSVMWCTLQN